MQGSLHQDAIVIDGLVVSRWGPEVFRDMHRGGLTAANCTCSVWEDFRATMLNIARWQRWFSDHADVITPVRSAADILRAKREGRVGIILGFQNTSAIEDRVETLSLFKALGVGVIQLTYNTQNLVGAGCWESRDGGLCGFGEEVVAEMGRLRILVDLSHVGPRTAADAIALSPLPCAYTHVAPAGLCPHPRNKSDAELRAVVDRGGFVGAALYPPFMPRGADSTLEDAVEMIAYMIDVCGEAAVGIGTDFTQGHDEAFFDWLRHDKGHARRVNPARGTAPFLRGLETLADYPALTAAMQRKGWSEARIRRVLGENWLRFLGEVWGG